MFAIKEQATHGTAVIIAGRVLACIKPTADSYGKRSVPSEQPRRDSRAAISISETDEARAQQVSERGSRLRDLSAAVVSRETISPAEYHMESVAAMLRGTF